MNNLKRREVAFFGKITAGVTHEINNILAIIQESSGLMEDILEITDNNAFPHKDKFIKSLNRVNGQIQRGIDIVARLNWFAHSPDHCPANIDLNEITEQMALLASRFARLKNVVLESDPSDPPLNIKSDPIWLIMALFESIEILLGVIDSGGKIILSSQKKQNRCVLSVGCKNTDLSEEDALDKIPSTERWTSLQETMACIGGTATTFGRYPQILLYLPESIDG